MGQSKKGIDCVAYVNTGTYDVPDWEEADCFRDLSQDLGKNTADAGTRKSPINKKRGTTKDLSWSGSIQEDGSVAANKLYDSFFDDTPLDMLILDGPLDEDGVRGVRCTCEVTKYATKQGREDLIYPELELWPTEDPDDHEPQRVLVASGAPVFSDF